MNDALPDIPRLYTGLAEAGACMLYMWFRSYRISRSRFVGSCVFGLVVLIGTQLIAGELPVSLWIPSMLSAVGLMGVTIWLGTSASLVEVAHLTPRAFILAELVASLFWQLNVFFSSTTPKVTPPAVIAVLVVYSALFGCAGFMERRNLRPGEPLLLERSDLWLTATIAIITFAMSNLSFVSTSTPFSGRLGPEVFYIRTLVDLCGFAALYAQQERILQMRAVSELSSIQARLESQHSQYLQSKTDIEALSRAHHDLKHQIALIRAEVDPHSQIEHFEQIDRSMAELGQRYHSGNPVLDVILTSKGRTCAAWGIDFTVIADGSLLEGMSSMDISTLFGNALDNAIEASRKVKDKQRRLIKLWLTSQGQMTVIRVENWFVGEVSYNPDGSLQTLKSDHDHHGYGVKSIRWTARKYAGEATTSIDGNWFRLTVLLPSCVHASGT
ncbi:GHKL domain-containing protein [Schaalia vaccimaxillae]|uniref:GHKL domain-containing protein n=1 Tax=Schaalia vaccimaxillae TaxID=183916 RepID=UPI0003B68E58|nr:GHKL domain-containing protein [Schaalia vaccimaxillae]